MEALKIVNFSVEEGEYVAIMGESGSGKTTLLNILAALDKPTAGTALLDGKDFSKIRESDVAAFRRDNLGHGISIQSQIGEGTIVRIDLSRREMPIE